LPQSDGIESVLLMIQGVLCESSRYATNPLWLLAADLHRSFAQAQKACSHESVLHNAQGHIITW
jgi:hypothetical protein